MTERFDFDPTVPCGYRERADGDFVSYHRYRDLAARLAEAERWLNECLAWVPTRGIGGQLRDDIRRWAVRAPDSADAGPAQTVSGEP